MSGEKHDSISIDTDAFGRIQLSVSDSIATFEADWRALEKCGLATLYQRFDWVKSWTETAGHATGLQPKVVSATCGGEPLFLLPLGLRSTGPLRLVEWLADSHSNLRMGLFSKRFFEKTDPETVKAIMTQIAPLICGADLLSLNCQPFEIFGHKNPLAALPGHASSNPAFTLDLTGGFDAALSRINGAKRRKKYRWQLNQLDSPDRISLRIAETPEDVSRILKAAFEQIAARFRKQGIDNVFADFRTQTFFEDLALKSLETAEPLLRLYALEIDGKNRATLTGGASGSHFSACFISLAEDEFASLSPGELLIYRVVEDCAERGFTCFDFGRGDERYKRSWTNQKIQMVDVTLAFGTAGKSLAVLQRGKSEAKRFVRNNEALWSIAKQMRARLRKAS